MIPALPSSLGIGTLFILLFPWLSISTLHARFVTQSSSNMLNVLLAHMFIPKHNLDKDILFNKLGPPLLLKNLGDVGPICRDLTVEQSIFTWLLNNYVSDYFIRMYIIVHVYYKEG